MPGFDDVWGRGEIGLADFEVDDVAALGFEGAGFDEDVEGGFGEEAARRVRLVSIGTLQDGDDAGSAGAAEILGESDIVAGELAFARFAAELLDDVADLRGTCCADGMAFAFEASAGVERHGSAAACFACRGEEAALSAVAEAQVFHGDDFGDGEAIVEFGEVDLLGAEAGLAVGLAGGGRGERGRW